MLKLRLDQVNQVDKWLRTVLWDHKLPEVDVSSNFEIHRCKGRLVFGNGTVKMIQGVREIFELIDAPQDEEIYEKGKIILIGRQIAGIDFERSFRQLVQ